MGKRPPLPPFPTRRSSDLDLGAATELRLDATVVRAADAHVTATGSQADRDRKSTRLNSSHLGISYAVFCLKKKNHRKEPQLERRQLDEIARSHNRTPTTTP